MSVAIATMGKYVPIFGSAPTPAPIEIVGGGGSSYGFERKRPQVIVDGVYDEEDNFRIKIIKVTEWS
jgi:hypothetical protein